MPAALARAIHRLCKISASTLIPSLTLAFGSIKTNSLSASALCVQQADFRWDLLEQVGTALLQIRSRNGLRGVGQCPGYYAECPPCVAGIVSARFLFRRGKWASESAPQSPGGHDQGRRCAPPFPQTRG